MAGMKCPGMEHKKALEKMGKESIEHGKEAVKMGKEQLAAAKAIKPMVMKKKGKH